MSLKLHQLLALSSGAKSRVQKEITAVYQKLDKKDLFIGHIKRYRSKMEDGEVFPDDTKRVGYTVAQALREVQGSMSTLWDLVTSQDRTNQNARANVCVDGQVLLSDIPVTTLLFLEKQLKDLRSIVDRLPVLDAADDWTYSEEADCFRAGPVSTVKTKKVRKNHIKYEATKEHPAQVDVFDEDITIGYWDSLKFSGAIPETVKKTYIARLQKLQDAIRIAREAANAEPAQMVSCGQPLFEYVFDAPQ